MAARNLSRLALVSLTRRSVAFKQTRHTVFAPPVRMLSSGTGNKGQELVYTAIESGEPGTEDYKIHFKDVSGKEISPWHDIPLSNGNYYNFVCEVLDCNSSCTVNHVTKNLTQIPRNSKAKMEVAKAQMHNPIVQDKKDGKLRFYEGPIYWNYGYLPQTWENPYFQHQVFSYRGDKCVSTRFDSAVTLDILTLICSQYTAALSATRWTWWKSDPVLCRLAQLPP